MCRGPSAKLASAVPVICAAVDSPNTIASAAATGIPAASLSAVSTVAETARLASAVTCVVLMAAESAADCSETAPAGAPLVTAATWIIAGCACEDELSRKDEASYNNE